MIMNSCEQAIQTPCEDADESVQEAKMNPKSCKKAYKS